MYYTKLILVVALLSLCTVTTGGCWGRTEVDDLAFVTAIGLDRGEDNSLYLTLQVTVPRAVAGGEGGGGGGNNNKTSLITTMRGKSILGLIDLANTFIDRRLSFVHGKVLIIGEELAREGLTPYISELVRFHEIRRTMFLIIAKGTAREFITKNKPVLEQNPAKDLEMLTLAGEKTGLIPTSHIHRFLVEMQSLGEESLVILAGVNEREQSKQENESNENKYEDNDNILHSGLSPITKPDTHYIAGSSPSVGGNPVELLGAAVFRKDKMVGEITGEEMRYVLYLKGAFKQGITIIEDPFADGKFIAADLRFGRPVQIRLTRNGSKFHIKILITLEGGLIGSQGEEDYTNPGILKVIERQLSTEIEKGCNNIIEKAQTLFLADIFAFGNKARRLTTTWQEWLDLNWPEKFPYAEIEASVKIELRRTGLLFRSPQTTADSNNP